MVKPNQLIVALDVEDRAAAEKIIKKISPPVTFYKVGMRLFTKEGPDFIRWLKRRKLKVFLDLKFYDIPNTVAQAVESATSLGVDLLTLHASGGSEMMKAAVKAAQVASKRTRKKAPLIFAVTVLTSMDRLDFLGIQKTIPDQVLHLAKLAADSKVDGVVCSPQELRMLKKKFQKRLLLLTPGIRFDSQNNDDQKRIATPTQALKDGADYLVIGRPVLQAEKPLEVIRSIL
ncbi:MAG: orotidine-5'-phosphate decarboxylase [Deltaproteobacteria bacterium]|nr:orotidine-5'-phosphate decarboxylase [Deltaproteobacteria bacterium]